MASGTHQALTGCCVPDVIPPLGGGPSLALRRATAPPSPRSRRPGVGLRTFPPRPSEAPGDCGAFGGAPLPSSVRRLRSRIMTGFCASPGTFSQHFRGPRGRGCGGLGLVLGATARKGTDPARIRPGVCRFRHAFAARLARCASRRVTPGTPARRRPSVLRPSQARGASAASHVRKPRTLRTRCVDASIHRRRHVRGSVTMVWPGADRPGRSELGRGSTCPGTGTG